MFSTGFDPSAAGQKRRRSTSPVGSSTSPTNVRMADIGGMTPILPDQHPPLTASAPSSTSATENRDQQQPRKRGTACEACRTKKSRCDSVRPVCGACAKAHIGCKYPSDSTLSIYEKTSFRILEGINRIERLLADKQRSSDVLTLSSPPLSYTASGAAGHARAASITTAATPMQIRNPDELEAEVLHMTWQRSLLLSKPKGDYEVTLESVLTWPVLTQLPDGNDVRPRSPYVDRKMLKLRPQRPHVDRLPMITSDSIKSLIQMFVKNVYLKYPVVDLNELDSAIAIMLENGGPGWDLDTCLVCLACALGSVSEDYGNFVYTSKQEPPTARLEAWRWWSLAQKRLAIAVSENSILAVQCQCLAGFWFMYNFEPLAAIKVLNAACLSWQAIHLEAEASADYSPGSEGYREYRKQRLLWTAMKAESELRIELSLPLSDAARLEFPREIPTPPSEFRVLHQSLGDEEEHRAWFYYVGDIFIRRCQNRIATEMTNIPQGSSGPTTVKGLVKAAKEFEVTLREWRDSLPTPIKFPDPLETDEQDEVYAPVLDDELQSQLRARYIECFESLYRPFTQIVLAGFGDADKEATTMAAKGLVFCLLRMKSELLLYRHQRLWIECRAALLCTLIMIAALLAKGSSRLRHPELLDIPNGWQKAMETVERNLLRWKTSSLEIEKYVEVLQWAKRLINL